MVIEGFFALFFERVKNEKQIFISIYRYRDS